MLLTVFPLPSSRLELWVLIIQTQITLNIVALDNLALNSEIILYELMWFSSFFNPQTKKIVSINNVCCVLSQFSRIQLFATLWTIALQALLTMGFSKARILEWAAMPFSMGLPDPGIKPIFLCLQYGRQVLYHQCHLGRPHLIMACSIAVGTKWSRNQHILSLSSSEI